MRGVLAVPEAGGGPKGRGAAAVGCGGAELGSVPPTGMVPFQACGMTRALLAVRAGDFEDAEGAGDEGGEEYCMTDAGGL